MSDCKRRAFTLTELLVVVIVLGTLAAVAAPKFARVLETRKTQEAENLLSAVRTEQEKRCTIGKGYTSVRSDIPTLAQAGSSSNYTYSFDTAGATAQSSGKDYAIKVLSYKDGRMCCEGDYCDKLSKDYPSCSSLQTQLAGLVDECASSAGATDPCETNPNSCECSTYASGHKCECDSSYAAAHVCECTGACDPCETNPNSCECSTYASAHKCECDSSYAAAHACECSGECDPCETNPNSCECSTYAAEHKCECDSSYASENAFECQCTANPNPGEECYEYKWVETARTKGEATNYYCIPEEDYCYGPQGFIACPQCKHESGAQTSGDGFTNGRCNQTSQQSYTNRVTCDASHLGQTSVSYCQKGYSETDSNGRVNYWYAHVTKTCQKVMRTSFSSGTGGGRRGGN